MNDEKDSPKSTSSDVESGGEGAGTLYITIGVQCAGKSTALKKLSCSDIALDDHDGIYKKVPWSQLPPGNQGRIVYDAITCPAEDPSNVKENWIAKIQNSIPVKGFHPAKRAELSNQLWEAIDRVRQEGVPELSETFDQLNHNKLTEAIAGSMKRLEDALSSGEEKVAWGNTNRFLTDMYGAVGLAQKYNYKVEFLIFNDTPFQELLYRNVRRGLTTGKFIPVEIMWRAKQDVDRTVKEGVTVEKIIATKGDRSLNNPHNKKPPPQQQQQHPHHRGPRSEEGGGSDGSEGEDNHHHHHEGKRYRGRGGGGRGGRGRGAREEGGGGGGGLGVPRSPSPSTSPRAGNIFQALDMDAGDD